MADSTLSAMTAVATAAPTTDLIYVVQTGPVDRKATPSQYIGNLLVDAANNLAIRNGTAAQVLRIYGTFTDASNYERFSISYTGGAYVIGSENAGTGNGRVVIIQTGGTNRWQFDTSGHMVALTDNSFDIGGSASANRPRNIYVGTTLTLGDAANIVTNATTGSKIGTATTQKIGFWNATPIVQPAGATQAAPAAYVTGVFGLDSNVNMQALYDLVVAMRTALVNAGIIKGAA